jgi:glycosyltransferase involved in cell wall biosynthesis
VPPPALVSRPPTLYAQSRFGRRKRALRSETDGTKHTDAQAGLLTRLRVLEAEKAALAARALHAETSAAAQALRAQAWSWQSGVATAQLRATRGSLFWRLTLPFRLAVVLARGLPANTDEGKVIRAAAALAREGGMPALRRAAREWRRRQAALAPKPPAPGVPAQATSNQPVSEGRALALSPLVLIVAELSVPQCAKYRVWQKQEHLSRLGVPSRVVDWHDLESCLSGAALATQAILYRVPGTPEMLELIGVLRGYGVPLAWEVDDLIFDEALYRQNSNLADLEPDLRRNVLDGVVLYRRALLAAGSGIASTPELAQAMRDAGVAQVDVVENALDQETLDLADRIRAERGGPQSGVLITYGSGTKTHDTDFLQAAPALLRLLAARPEIRLRVIGDLTLPGTFAAFAPRIERVPALPYARYLALLGESDISLAPLEPSVFNDAKSNIKFLEASVLGVPSVCSPRAQFVSIVGDGANGFLAEGDDAWFAALDALAGDAALRARLGEAALRDSLARYAPEAVARAQVAPLLVGAVPRQPGVLRVLMANVFYAPRSYGGATIVVEEMARLLHARADTEVAIVTTLGDVKRQALTRTVQDGITVFGLPTNHGDVIAEFDDPQAGEMFGRVLDAVLPDIVHLHSVQQLSASIATACRARGIPYVITLHDPWWLCARQFMVREDGTYCFQKRIDLHVCEACVPGARHLRARHALLRDALDGAALLMSPSAAHADLYVAQGIAPGRIAVVPNGVRLPAAPVARVAPAVLRFGYVGGNEKVKGYGLVRQCFSALARGDWELVLVDNTLNLGFSSIEAADWRLRGSVRIVPAYSQDTMEAFFAGIDVLLFPSQWKESFGLTVREALARDVWVITTAGGGPAEAVVDGVNGTVIPLDGEYHGLLGAVQALLDEPARLAGFRNPLVAEIRGYGAQAGQVRDLLAHVKGWAE